MPNDPVVTARIVVGSRARKTYIRIADPIHPAGNGILTDSDRPRHRKPSCSRPSATARSGATPLKVECVNGAAVFGVVDMNDRRASVAARVAEEPDRSPAVDPAEAEVGGVAGQRFAALESPPGRFAPRKGFSTGPCCPRLPLPPHRPHPLEWCTGPSRHRPGDCSLARVGCHAHRLHNKSQNRRADKGLFTHDYPACF